jgi:hypothetical protein
MGEHAVTLHTGQIGLRIPAGGLELLEGLVEVNQRVGVAHRRLE